MVGIVFFIERISLGLYALCGLGILLGIRSYFLAQQFLHGSQFELEKELARYRLNNATTTIIGLLEIGLAVFAVAQVVAPTLRAQPPQTITLNNTPAETQFVTAAPSSLLELGTPAPAFAEGVEIPGLEDELNLQPFATPTLTPTPVGTIIPDVPPAIGCDTESARLMIPANGMVVFEATNVVGSASIDNFAFYRFELNGPSTFNEWTMFREYTVPVSNGELGQIVPAQLIPGEYKFRLAVFDITNQMQASCTVTIIISPPIPTPTPLTG